MSSLELRRYTLIKDLKTRGNRAYEIFYRALRDSNQDALADLLIPELKNAEYYKRYESFRGLSSSSLMDDATCTFSSRARGHSRRSARGHDGQRFRSIAAEEACQLGSTCRTRLDMR